MNSELITFTGIITKTMGHQWKRITNAYNQPYTY